MSDFFDISNISSPALSIKAGFFDHGYWRGAFGITLTRKPDEPFESELMKQTLSRICRISEFPAPRIVRFAGTWAGTPEELFFAQSLHAYGFFLQIVLSESAHFLPLVFQGDAQGRFFPWIIYSTRSAFIPHTVEEVWYEPESLADPVKLPGQFIGYLYMEPKALQKDDALAWAVKNQQVWRFL
jgi:hypothetical protein